MSPYHPQPRVVIYYVWLVYLPTFANLVSGLPLSEGFIGGTISLAVFCLCLPLWGTVADRIGQRNLLIIACVLLAVLSYFLLDALTSANFSSFLITNMIGCALTAMISAVISPISCDLFPVEVRTSGIGVPYAMAGALFGSTSPLITTWFIKAETPQYIGYYMMLFCLIVFVSAVLLPKTVGRKRIA